MPSKIRVYTPEQRARQAARQRERYAKDPEYRARLRRNTKAWEERNPEKRRQIVTNQRRRKKAIVDEVRAKSSCKECGESHPACLDFHHRDPSQKEHVVALMGSRGLSPDKIFEELAKCDVLCANCHRKHHWAHRWPISA